MRAQLYVVAASHPCWAVARAFELKGVGYRRIEWPPGMHAAMQQLRFGSRTVPGAVFDGHRVSGSRAIMRRLDELVPEPRLYPDERVAELDRWGDEALQSLPRRLTWWALRRRPAAILSYAQDSRLPFPAFVTRALTPLIAPVEWRLNSVSDESARRDLRELPGLLDQVDGWVDEGLVGGEQPNAADLQIGSSLALLRTLGDVRPVLEGRPCGRLASRWFPSFPGDVPAGTFPRDWL
ncbi:MAG TPA: glutathione S-transferase N-terminal domain-containing protein [Solirubrobacteraceae bacterium]|nr:glutathione S-transferase N-terminal domain-containing protein [Solirubrobacteraceae bacterium]